MSKRYDQCDETCTVDCGHCKGDHSHLETRTTADGRLVVRKGQWQAVLDPSHPLVRAGEALGLDWVAMGLDFAVTTAMERGVRLSEAIRINNTGGSWAILQRLEEDA